ncbi:MAG: hypothetical protein AVDCRST_MAG68-4047 [uncultured Gemmatimonadetes bacterium]|uniref:Carboxypeptidase regulatory-like domain-containing protein n=1 Tax=uncultured Gemmatimonadota bacterium TaxID=203437 RepID=A0A6J4M255_9BACT|nr:MAG: hypothetical protein AVDCRST_MAG68-4047 [uncultured Gemmatimonadota bacterium]
MLRKSGRALRWALAAGAMAVPAAAQAPAGGEIHGRVTERGSGAPVPFTVVRLLAGDTTRPALATTLTDSAGAFRLQAAAPGSYRLGLARVGVQGATSPAVEVGPGASVKHDLAVTMGAVMLPALVVGERCHTADQLDEAPALAALWREAQKAGDVRRAFDHAYRYSYDWQQDLTASLRLLRDRRMVKRRTVTNVPAETRARDARLREMRASVGYGSTEGGLNLDPPDLPELLGADFLRTHCVFAAPEPLAGAWGVRFRPVGAPREGRVDLQGTLWIGQDDFEVRAFDYQYLRQGRPFGGGRITYTDVAVPGGTIRLPSRVQFRLSGRVLGARAAVVSDLHGSVSLTGHRDFTRTPPPGS